MRFFSFVAGFFRESGATESSTRLVGILAFLIAFFLSMYAVMAEKTSAEAIGVIVTNFTYGAIALGLRKGGEGELPAKGDTAPVVVVPEDTSRTVPGSES